MSVLCAGSWMVDLVASHLPHVPEPGGLVYAPSGIDLRLGGHSANVSVCLSQLGEPHVYSAGSIGDDALGGFVLDSLRAAGVQPLPEKQGRVATAKNVALIVEGEDRRFIAELASNTLLSPKHVDDALGEVKPLVFYLGTVGGLHYIDSQLAPLLQAAHSRGAYTVLDLITPTGGWSHLAAAYPHIDLLHCNSGEAAGATQEADPMEAARHFTRAGVGVSVVSSGSRGLVASDGSNVFEVPAFQVPEVDPTGAGDALCAGLIHALLKAGTPSTRDLAGVLVEASAAGAACVTATGATPGVTRENVDRLLAEQRSSVEQRVRVHR